MVDPHGIPTVYRDVQFRSRLEARWARFFDLVGWVWQYEPFDLPGWIPDFVLIGDNECVLVEVKPIVAFPQGLADELDRSCPPSTPDDDGEDREVLILGCTLPVDDGLHRCETAFGWLRQGGDWGHAVLGRWFAGRGKIGFCHCTQSYHDRITGTGDGGCYGELAFDMSEARRFWDQAGNATQWKSPRRPA